MTLKHGYFYDQSYTYGAYPESSPERLAFVSLLSSHRPPNLAQPFRCLELGCGQGFGLCLQAASYPHAQFVGLDFKAEHIAHGRSLAAGAGLTNVQFLLADFLTLGQNLPPGWGEFDIVIAHGVLGWVSPSTGARLLAAAAEALRPAGLFYVSYNSYPGWLPAVPFQSCVKTFQQRMGDGKPALDAALGLFQQMQSAGALLFQEQPALAGRLDGIGTQDPAYLLHEYNHSEWQPQYVDQVIRQAAELDLHYVGSATLPEGFQGLLPDAFRQLVQQQSDPDLRELVRDLLTNQSFRRDVYAKGRAPLWSGDATQMIRELEVIRMIPQLPEDTADLFCFSISCGEVRGNPDWFKTCLQQLQDGPRSVADLEEQLRQAGQATLLPELLQNLALLLHKNLVALHPRAGDPSAAQRFNRHVAARVAAGGPYRCLASPASGNLISLNDGQLMLLHASLQGCHGEALEPALRQNLQQLGRQLQKDKRPLEGDALDQEIQRLSRSFESETLPLLRRLQAVA